MVPSEKQKTIAVGDFYHIYIGPGGPKKIHIIGVLHQLEETIIVYRWYSHYKKRWIYQVDNEYILSRQIEWGDEDNPH